MPTHHCIPCATSRVRCCICAGHQHGLYGATGEPAAAGDPDWFNAMGTQGRSRGREAAQRLLQRFGQHAEEVFKPPSENLKVYTRTEFGVTRVFSKGLDGVEVELIAVPAIPAKSLEHKLTLWDHLLKDD